MNNDGCSCHICPPCAWCVSLNEVEADLYAQGGVDAVIRHREQQEEQEPE